MNFESFKDFSQSAAVLICGQYASEINTQNLKPNMYDLDEVGYSIADLFVFEGFHDSSLCIDDDDSSVDKRPNCETGQILTMFDSLLAPRDVDAEALQQSEDRLKTGTETGFLVRKLRT